MRRVITAQVESFRERVGELQALIPTHYDALSLHKGRFPLQPQWPIYFNREAAGELLFMTLRKDGEMIGYWITFVAPGLHYATCLTSQMDIWFMHPAHIIGKAPLILINAVERELRRRGVNLWFAGSKDHKPCGPLFERLGFQKVETFYSKWLEA